MAQSTSVFGYNSRWYSSSTTGSHDLAHNSSASGKRRLYSGTYENIMSHKVTEGNFGYVRLVKIQINLHIRAV